MHRKVWPAAVAAGVLIAGSPAYAAESPWVGRVEAEQMAAYNSNVLLAPSSPSDFLFRTKLGGTGRYTFPTKTMILGQANYNLIRFAQQGTYNTSMFIGNAMVMQPIYDFATVYTGAMGIVSHGDTATGVWRMDKDVMGGFLLQTPVSKTGAVFGGYHLDWMFTDVAASAFRGHTFQVGYRHAFTDTFNVTGGYRFFWKDADVLAKQGRHTVGVSGQYGLWQDYLSLLGRAEYSYIASVDGQNSSLIDLSLLLNGGF